MEQECSDVQRCVFLIDTQLLVFEEKSEANGHVAIEQINQVQTDKDDTRDIGHSDGINVRWVAWLDQVEIENQLVCKRAFTSSQNSKETILWDIPVDSNTKKGRPWILPNS